MNEDERVSERVRAGKETEERGGGGVERECASRRTEDEPHRLGPLGRHDEHVLLDQSPPDLRALGVTHLRRDGPHTVS
eukprot:6184170-Pleurochrysis_carterae.AAC.3